MTTELLTLLGAMLFAAAAVSGGLAHFGHQRPWRRVVLASRIAGLVPLSLALTMTVAAHGGPSPYDLRQMALGLGLATVLVGLALAWRHGAAAVGPVLDLIVLGLVLAGLLVIQPGGPALDCVERWFPFWTYWGLFLLGSGSTLAAGSAALDLMLGTLLPGDRLWTARASSHRVLANATLGTLVILGGGLALAAWWSWRSGSSLAAGDPRQTWMGATWLAAAMSLLAWQLERRGERTATALAVLAAAMALFGLLALPDLQRLWSA